MIAERFPEVQALPDDEKLQLAAELWRDVVGQPSETDEAMVALMESRLAEYQEHPERVIPWGEVRARLQGEMALIAGDLSPSCFRPKA